MCMKIPQCQCLFFFFFLFTAETNKLLFCSHSHPESCYSASAHPKPRNIHCTNTRAHKKKRLIPLSSKANRWVKVNSSRPTAGNNTQISSKGCRSWPQNGSKVFKVDMCPSFGEFIKHLNHLQAHKRGQFKLECSRIWLFFHITSLNLAAIRSPCRVVYRCSVIVEPL